MESITPFWQKNESMKKTKIFVYPLTTRFNEKLANPYIKDVCKALNNHFVCVNYNKPSNIGFLNISKYFFQSNLFHLNWIEDLPDKKGGFFQTLFFFLVLIGTKLFGKKIIWTVHNKSTHQKKNLYIKKFLLYILSRNANYIITHSKEGIEYVRQLNPKIKKKHVLYIPHPVKSKILPPVKNYEYDIIIWGNIMRYKGTHLFLQYLSENSLLETYKILIIGKIENKNYEKELRSYPSSKIIIINRFIEEEELTDYIQKSKIILFTYQNEYVLSSGALTDSLGFNQAIIGPNTGAFNDLAKEDLIFTYKNMKDLPAVIDKILASKKAHNEQKIKNFIQQNSWENYGSQLYKWTKQKS